MKKIFSLLAMATVLFASSCNKTPENVTPENNETPITLSPEFANLQNSLYELNQEMIPSSTETRSFWRWLCVGICDAVGAVCGYQVGNVPGAIVLGSAASAIAIEEFQPMSCNSGFINSFKVEEQDFQTVIRNLKDASGAEVGVFHNRLIRSAYAENGNDLYEMSSEELVPMFREALPAGYNNLSMTNEELTESVQDFVYSPASGETTNEFVMGLCEKYPEAAQELLVMLPILDGISASATDKAALDYTTRVMKTIERSKVAAKSKNAILCGASVAFESKVLWNLSENQNN